MRSYLSSKWILSATEIESFETCRRKWSYRYLDGLENPQSKSAELGSAVHSFLEKYLKNEPIDHQSKEGQIASAGFRYLPTKLSTKNVERSILFTKNGLFFRGIIDFSEDLGEKTWLIGDHKTTSDLNRALTTDELKNNIQANIYAQWAFTEKDAEEVQLRWVYYKTQSAPKAISVEAKISRQEAESNFDRIAATANEILSIVHNQQPTSTQPKNTSACFKYGRCPFFARCKGTRVENYFSKQTKNSEVKEQKVPTLSQSKQSSFHLYVDCVPTKNIAPYEHTIELSELLKPVLSKIQKEKELSHYRLAGYGQHVGLIANYLSEHLHETAYDGRTAIISSVKTPEGCDTLQTLTAAASQVIRGF